MKIGIIGAENSHTRAIAKVINVEKKIPGFTVEYVWGETAEFAKQAAKEGKIPHIVSKSKEMLGKIDALIVDHRHARYHLAAALPFVKEGIPTFVDKPFCYRAEEGKEFLKVARKHKAPVTSFSVLPHQKSFQRMLKKAGGIGTMLAGATFGPCDPRSKYGGIFFYGIHQLDLALHLFGYDVQAAQVLKSKNGATTLLYYPGGLVVTMHLIRDGSHEFSITAVGEKGELHQHIVRDESPYLTGVKIFTRMFKTGKEPLTDEQMLRPVQVLEAMQLSYGSGEKVKVRK